MNKTSIRKALMKTNKCQLCGGKWINETHWYLELQGYKSLSVCESCSLCMQEQLPDILFGKLYKEELISISMNEEEIK